MPERLEGVKTRGLDHLAQQLTMPRSAVIRIAVLEYLKKRVKV